MKKADEAGEYETYPAYHYETKDSGKRAEFASGMVRDAEEGKARFDLLLPLGIPYRDQMLTRFAELMERGARKYDARNWELAEGEAELARYRSSALRHLIQWVTGETDEDHAAAVMFNVVAGETVQSKMRTIAIEHFTDPEAGAVGHEDRDSCSLMRPKTEVEAIERGLCNPTCCDRCERGETCCAGFPVL